MLKREYWINFANHWNNFKEYKSIPELAKALDTTPEGVKSKAKKYKLYLKSYPALNLPPIIDRSKITNDGFIYIEHDINIEHSQEIDRTKSRFVVTSAQYGADVNEDFLSSLKVYCKENDAQLIIMPVRYGAVHEPVKSILNDYMSYGGHMLSEHLEINTASILPTAKEPLSGLQIFCSERTNIFAHPQIAFETIGRSNIHIPKAMMTTGAVTYPQYGFNRTSEIAEIFHDFGALVVELEKDMFHFRHIIADVNGEFNDYAKGVPKLYTSSGVKNTTVDSLVCGDWHTGETCPVVAKETYESIVPSLEPSYIFKHDFFNGHSVSHHDERCATTMMKKERMGMNCLKTELDACSFELSRIKHKANGAKIVMVASNHNDHLDKYISEERYNKDIRNKEEALKLGIRKLNTNKTAFEIAMLDRGHDDVVFLERNQECKHHGIELAMHGDVGINGARGSAVSFKRIGFKCIVGHSHSPSIKGNCLTVGTSTPLRLGYTRGLTGWMNTHAIVYSNGQRQMINILNGKWHG